MPNLASLSSAAGWPAKRVLRLGERAGRRAQDALSEPARRAILSSLDTALSAADAALRSPLAREAGGRILASPLADDVLQRFALRALDSPEFQRPMVRAIDSPEFERLLAQALASPEAERLITQVIDSRLFGVIVERLLASDDLWFLIDEIAQSPAVTAAISHQSVGFANQVAGIARQRSRTADDRLERLAARLAHPRRAVPQPGAQEAT